MNHDKSAEMLRTLEALLDQERAALVKGDLGALESLLARKTAIIERLEKEGCEVRALPGSLREKARRNQDLLAAVQEGLQQAARRLAMIRELRGRLKTYDADGQTQTIDGDVVHRIEKRA